jgi:phage terminase small subunit
MGLNGRRERFCIEYLKDWNASAAAIRAGYSPDASRQIGSRLLTNDDIKEEIGRIRDEALGTEKEHLKYYVLQNLKKLAGSNITDVVTIEDGVVKTKDTEELEPEVKESIESISETVTQAGGTLSVKMHSKVRALELLGRYAGMFDDKLELSGKISTQSEKLTPEQEEIVKIATAEINPAAIKPLYKARMMCCFFPKRIKNTPMIEAKIETAPKNNGNNIAT